MTPNKIRLIRESFKTVQANPELATEIFYAQLFNRNPSLKALFPKDLTAQKGKLFLALKAVVASLTDLDAIVPVLRDLGAKHAGYGVCDAHYDDVGFALIETLSIALCDGFTLDVEEAWTGAYELISATMQAGVIRRAA